MTQRQQTTQETGKAITIRPARPTDARPLEKLAQLDSASALTGEVLIAERGGDPVAAIEIETGSAIGDPFQRTAEMTAMLAIRRRDLLPTPPTTRWWRLRTHRSADLVGAGI